MFTQLFSNLLTFCREFQIAGTVVLIIIGIILVAVPMLVGTDEQRQRAKNRIPGVIIGTVLLVGAFTLAATAAKDLDMDGNKIDDYGYGKGGRIEYQLDEII